MRVFGKDHLRFTCYRASNGMHCLCYRRDPTCRGWCPFRALLTNSEFPSAHFRERRAQPPKGIMKPRRRFAMILSLSVLGGIVGSPACAQTDLARAYRIIAAKQFVDLTHSFDSSTPVWSGFGQAKMTPAA